jgi:hypothetical protein
MSRRRDRRPTQGDQRARFRRTGRELYDYAGDVSRAIDGFVRDQGTGHRVPLLELRIYGCDLSPMLIGRVLREYGHIVTQDLRLRAAVHYDTTSRHIVVEEPITERGRA